MEKKKLRIIGIVALVLMVIGLVGRISAHYIDSSFLTASKPAFTIMLLIGLSLNLYGQYKRGHFRRFPVWPFVVILVLCAIFIFADIISKL